MNPLLAPAPTSRDEAIARAQVCIDTAAAKAVVGADGSLFAREACRLLLWASRR